MPDFKEYENYDAIGLAELIRNGEVTAEEVLEAAIARCDARNPALNAVVQELYDHGREMAVRDLPSGPLAGVPYLIKDLGLRLPERRPPAAASSWKMWCPMPTAKRWCA